MEPVALTRQGRVQGESSRGIDVFRGIPYAAPPVGALRFRSPRPPAAWSGTRDATRFRRSAPQASPVLPLAGRLLGGGGPGEGEDCLYLNVWTPQSDGRRRPVMVWIHGGAFVMGSGSSPLYSGRRLARRGDTVVVTINYRLGALGGLNLRALRPAADAAGSNQGLRDQMAALAWVRDNIAEFGGDPENVTVFGESAGAMSVGTLLGTPGAQGLFQRAILQSGAGHNVSSREHAAEIAELFLHELGLSARDDDALSRAPLSAILRAQSSVAIQRSMRQGILAWQPSVDGDVLPAKALEGIAQGVSKSVPVLVGTNADEWNLFLLGDREGRRLDSEGLRRRLERALPGADASGRPRADAALEAYLRARSGRGRESSVRFWVAFQSDRIFHYPATRVADLQLAHQPSVFAYLFTFAPPVVGACHGLELPFVFGTLRAPLLGPLLGWSPSAQALSRAMQDAWIALARTGNPAHEGLPDWPSYDAARRATMRLGRRCGVVDAPFEDERRFWESLRL
jgi:para-nitrobenzyl esterase